MTTTMTFAVVTANTVERFADHALAVQTFRRYCALQQEVMLTETDGTETDAELFEVLNEDQNRD